MDSYSKHQGINEAAVMSDNPVRQRAGLRGMGLAPTASNLEIVRANIARNAN